MLASVLLILVAQMNNASAQADTLLTSNMFDSVSVYAGQGVNHNLIELPGRIFSGTLDWDKTYFYALGFGKVRNTLAQSLDSLKGSPVENILHGYEIVLLHHNGLQNNAEVGAAYTLRTPDMKIGLIGVNFSPGAGLSYAFGNPSYEAGTQDNPQRRYRLQLLAEFEFEWRLHGYENQSLITRVYHRSGVYGLIAPRYVGSNFLACGFRYKF
jgi:hypothetical protein